MIRSLVILMVLAGLLAGCASLKLNPYNLETRVVGLPFKTPISFDDLTYDAHLQRVIIPAGETGEVALIDPKNMNIQLISGFSQQGDDAKPIVGASSAAVAGGFLFGVDQASKTLRTIDLSTNNVAGLISLQASPEDIRYVSATGELWVTEKDLNQIEIFSVSAGNPPVLQLTGHIPIPNGPEALVIDDSRGLAFTNRPKQGLTDVIQVMTHSVIGQWGNGCTSANGLAVDENEGYLFVACGEGKLVVMDINNNGYQVTSQNYGAELDSLAYNPRLHHIYLPSSASGIVAIFQLQALSLTPQSSDQNEKGITLRMLGTADTAIKSKCVTVDDLDNIWVCSPNDGQVFYIHDAFPDSGSVH